MKVRRFTIAPDDDGARLDRWFRRHMPEVPMGTIGRWTRKGEVRLDGARVKPDARIATGQELRVPPPPERTRTARPPARPLSDEERALAAGIVLTETEAALVLNKPPGLATQGGSKQTAHVDRLLDAYAGEDDPRPRLVHRLDKDTSGALLIARTPGSAAFFSKRFSGRKARKTYWALVVGVPDVKEGTIDASLAKQPGTGGEKMHVDEEAGQLAKTRYRVVERAGHRTAWLELEPLTGRTHQLRVHCAAIGHPIVGDGKYGGRDAFLTGGISRKLHLHARRLVIEAPSGPPIDVTAPLPEHFAASMAGLGFEESLSDAGPLVSPPPERSRAAKKAAAKAHSKTYRRAQRKERGSRGRRGPGTAGKGRR